MNNKYNKGFIALLSVIIITSVLLIIAISVNFSGIFGRVNIYKGELKSISEALASSCVDYALLKLGEDDTFSGGMPEIIVDSINNKKCYIFPFSPSGSSAIISVRGEEKGAYTFYEFEVDTDTLKILAFKEIANK